MNQINNDEIRNAVRERYEKVAESGNSRCGCSEASCCDDSAVSAQAISMEMGYSDWEVSEVPEGANMGLGCGNPQAIASLKPGETVLDLGSGGGFDCFLAAKQVGNSGHVIGIDMTPEMVSRARHNAEKSNYSNVEFRLGEIENLPVADSVVDVIISNCVINLSPEKEKVFQECFRVLKPGGRLAISDIVATSEIPDDIKKDMTLFTGCVAGASTIEEIKKMLQSAGFYEIEIKPKDESREFIREWAPNRKIEDYVVSATIEAVKTKAQ
ncbi:arsenite methyltransferase [bacterium]|nr:arsenite methyltransferase [bacterium]MBU1635392.1 arsenite methyltransferase [bacterium]MBU1874015.1 arsenite methyltransferase [bacterium]